jgi:hypothetical protein
VEGPKTIATLLHENALSPEDGEKLITTMLHDAAREAHEDTLVEVTMVRRWLSNSAFDTAGVVHLLVGPLADIDHAADKLHYNIACGYPEGDSPTVNQVRAALLDELSAYCERLITGFAAGDDARYNESHQGLFYRIAELAETKAECDRPRATVGRVAHRDAEACAAANDAAEIIADPVGAVIDSVSKVSPVFDALVGKAS